jgi:hypothetical protein
MLAVSSVAIQSRAPIWPVLAAPFVAGIYYLTIKSAFEQSIISALGQTSASEIDLADIDAPHWGSHWIYRLAAEIVSASFATFVAAGLAHGRERVAAVVGGCIISLGFLARIGPGEVLTPEPWYQYGIEGLMVFAAPILGGYVAHAAEYMHRQVPDGFGGIARAHFVWLWLVFFWYALGLITPVAHILLRPDGVISTFIVWLVDSIAAAAVAIPGYFGLAVLSGHIGSRMGAALRNLVGMAVLIVGSGAALAVQFGWYRLVQTVYEALFG